MGHPTNKKLEKVLSLGIPLTAVASYYGRDEDPIRCKWSSQFKELLFDTINDRLEDDISMYTRTQEILRSKTEQPKAPMSP